jgi:malonate transporter and related proteins
VIKILADALVPIFAGLLLGYVAGLRGVMDNKNVQTLITLVMSFAVPCALFLSIISAPRAALREEIPSALVFTVGYTVVYALSFLWTTYGMNLQASDSSVVALTVAFPNSAAVGLPLLASVFGSQATVTVAASLAIGSITITPITLAILEANRGGPGGGLTLSSVATSLLHSLKRPIVWAPLLGLVASIAGLTFPSFVDRSLHVIGMAADGSALVLTGLVVSAQRFEMGGNTLVAVILKNVLQPALALGIAMLMHLSIDQIRYVTLINAIPCGFFGVVFGKGFGANPKILSSGLIASYLIGIGTLAAWIVIVDQLR